MKSENLFTESENTDSTFGTQYYIVNSGFHEKTESENIKVKSEEIFRVFGEKWKEFLCFWRKVERKKRKSENLDSLFCLEFRLCVPRSRRRATLRAGLVVQ